MEGYDIRELKECGVDVDYGIKSHMGNEKMYFRILGLVMSDEKFEDLFECADSGDADKIFEVAHSLKGTIGNVGAKALDGLISEICETTRRGSIDGVREKTFKAKKLHDNIVHCINA